MYVGSTPTGSSIEKHLNLHSVFSYSEFGKAFNKLKKKNKYRQTSADFNLKDRYSDKRILNALGKFIQKHSSDQARGLYREVEIYSLRPYRGISILKKSGKYRPLLVPSPLDRLVFLTALPRIKGLIYKRLLKFSALGVGVKSEEGLKITIVSNKIFEKVKQKKTRYVLALDFQDFFSTIHRDKLHRKLKTIFSKAEEKELLKLLVLSINNPIESDDLFKAKFKNLNLETSGIPQGLAYSPLLASFFATSLDALVRRNKSVISYRYLDDMVIIGPNKRNLIKIYRKIKSFSAKLGLKLHDLGGKTKILPVINPDDSFDFLGISFSKSGKHITNQAIKKFLETIKTEILTGRGLRTSPDNIKRVFKEYVTGWKQYYSAICPEHYKEIAPILANEVRTYMLKKKAWKRIYLSDENLFNLKE
ncbi:MAG: hypothetical protein UY47_C0001G0078 [Parcubacteria group bacterium GW2011_GWB1_49_7]|uniref:Reverse transcriptase domain-containing protein n=1 Tax=Candidatus Zambryskibacteria bacterium RIFCSPHIGHO2_01_FULL_46_25 TaxID=1802738 RepID=A0A1G2SZB9_9BACT|nr:MAG: hypothetical protein UY47_C0001G0078 [Parcubacteria group bacterium GW2011_GWB1_49_7]OHA90397.1 MAG: hypothetical protein A2838_02250 [Candidatus Zambryskibacteria bacterium RIFCSPHIGHO2_01_FULL_46_25]OHB01551.1 MAG: hypothetical protein A3F53_00140 [Candidatus Zambryskibacteria bacterium RIFCSPHIGHO2_12_FULL_48_10]